MRWEGGEEGEETSAHQNLLGRSGPQWQGKKREERDTKDTVEERGDMCAELIAWSWCLRPSESQMDMRVECSKM